MHSFVEVIILIEVIWLNADEHWFISKHNPIVHIFHDNCIHSSLSMLSFAMSFIV